MKRLFIAFFFLTALAVNAQSGDYTDLKGVTFNAKKILYSEEGSVRSEEISQLFNFSFKDLILVHNVIKDGIESQFYKLQNLEVSYNSSSKKTTFKVDAVSGVSGSTYKYEININSEGVAELLLNGYLYSGDTYKLKTYMQD